MTAKAKRSRPGLLAAWAGLLLGGLASIAANLAYAVYVQDPSYVTTIGAVLWPAFTLVGFEVIVRPAWPMNGWRSASSWIWGLFRVAAVAVGIVAAVSSYGNMSGLMIHERDTWFVAHFGPGAIDGLMVTSAAALIVIERDGATRSTRPDRPGTLTAHPTRSIAWAVPNPIRLPDPIDSIEQTIRSAAAVHAASTRSGPRSTATVPDPIARPNPTRSTRPDPTGPNPAGPNPIDPSPIGARSDRSTRPDRPDWTTRSTIDPAAASSQPIEALLSDLRAALTPTDPPPSAESIRLHYRIGPTKARALRDALQTDRSQPGAGGQDEEIN